LLVFVLSAVAILHAEEGTTVVTLKQEVHVTGPNLCIGDLAEVTGPLRDAVSAVEIGFAALPNQVRNVQSSLVQSQLERAGFSAGQVQVTGAPLVCARTRFQTITKSDIDASLREFIALQMPWDMDSAVIETQVPSFDITLPEGELTFVWKASPDYKYLGHGSFRGEIQVNGVTRKNVVCRVSIEAYGPVLVAANSIPRGQIVSAPDLSFEQRALSTLPRDAITDPSDVIGMTAIKTIFTGQLLTRQLVTPRTLVRKNQIVTVETVASGLVVRARAKALADGKEGHLVLCENLDSKDQFMGEVRKDGTVLVR